MENQVESIECHVDSIDEIKDGTCFFDEKLPDHVLEKIISFVSNKDNCFLVNKRFQKESINVTRNRYRLVLDDENIKEFESILKIKKKFDEIRYDSLCYKFTESSDLHEIIQYFGSSIKTFILRTRWFEHMYADDFMDILDPMENLERLTFSSVLIKSNVSSKTVQLNHLKSLAIVDRKIIFENCSLESLSCPALQELIIESDFRHPEFIYNFLSRHTQLKQLTYHDPPIDTIQCLMAINGLKLTSLQIIGLYEGLHSFGTASAIAFVAALSKQKRLEVLELPITEYLFENQVLQAISKLPMLKTLSCYSYQHDAYIADILQMDNLRALNLAVCRLESIKPLATVQNLKLEELKLELDLAVSPPQTQISTIQQLELLQAIAKNLRNLKKARFAVIPIEDVLVFALNSPSLQSLTIVECEYSPILLNILKLQNLTELGCDAECLEQSEVISTIMEHGKKLEQIIVYHFHKTFNAFHAYSSQFPVVRRGSKWDNTVMMRSLGSASQYL